MHRGCRLLAVLALAGLVALLPRAVVASSTVTVFAAASLKEALDAQAHRFASATGNRVVVAYGASSALAKQIEAGAPADIFVSADRAWMDDVAQHALVSPGTRADLLRNTLVLIAPSRSTSTLRVAPHFGLVAALGDDRLAMANPDSVPAGRYARRALEHLGVWKAVEPHVARTADVRGALALVSRGEAPFGIVYATDARADPGVKVIDTFAPDSHPPIVYPIAMLSGSKSPAAPSLLEYLRSAPARAVWEQYGFGLVQ